MQIRVGYELVYRCPRPTPMIVTLSIHYTRVSDIITRDHHDAPSVRSRRGPIATLSATGAAASSHPRVSFGSAATPSSPTAEPPTS